MLRTKQQRLTDALRSRGYAQGNRVPSGHLRFDKESGVPKSRATVWLSKDGELLSGPSVLCGEPVPEFCNRLLEQVPE